MNNEEELLQAECVKAFSEFDFGNIRPILAANFNNPLAIKKEISKGMQPGIPDMTLYISGTAYFIELKTKKGTFNANQKRFIPFLNACGFITFEIRSKDDFICLLTEIRTITKNSFFRAAMRYLAAVKGIIFSKSKFICKLIRNEK